MFQFFIQYKHMNKKIDTTQKVFEKHELGVGLKWNDLIIIIVIFP